MSEHREPMLYESADVTPREKARELKASGLGYDRIARELGVSKTTIVRWLRPAYADLSRRRSREAKRLRTGVCVDCGAVTRYNGHHPHRAVSDLCHPCARKRDGAARVGHDPVRQAVLAVLSSGVPVSFTTIRDTIIGAGGQPSSIHPLLYQRLIPQGYARRVERGVYVAGPALNEASRG